MTKPILYSFRRCPYAMRARLALDAAGIECELREVVLRDKPAALLEASPKGTVPVLVLEDSSVLEESLDIALWALARHDPLNWLLENGTGAEEMRSLIDRCEDDFKFHLDRYKYANRYEGVVAEEHRQSASEYLMSLNSRLESEDWLFGKEESLADVAIAPFVRQFANTDRAWFEAQSWAGLKMWLLRFLASSRFVRIMEKLPPWQPGELGVRFPFVQAL